MSTLLLRLAGPMQSWGTQSRFSVRDAGLEPSKSGVIGLLCAALGKPREEKPDDGWPSLKNLSSLKMGVRVDFPGTVKMDYHTAGGVHKKGQTYGVVKADGGKGDPVTSHRYYLADADFLVGLEGENEGLLSQLYQAVACPRWQICLGRKAFVPSVPVFVPGGLKRDMKLQDALIAVPWPHQDRHVPRDERPEKLRLVLETDATTGEEVRRDVPLCFELPDRQFGLRHVTNVFRTLGSDIPIRSPQETEDVPF